MRQYQHRSGSNRSLIFVLSATAFLSLAFARTTREGGSCGSDSDCLGRRVCRGKVCKKKIPLGASCANRHRICSNGYTCDRHGPKPLCMNILKKGATKCMANRYTKCAPGLECSGNFRSAVCVDKPGSKPSRKPKPTATSKPKSQPKRTKKKQFKASETNEDCDE